MADLVWFQTSIREKNKTRNVRLTEIFQVDQNKHTPVWHKCKKKPSGTS